MNRKQTVQEHLTQFAQSANEAAFREVVAEYYAPILAAAERRTGDRELAQEVAQGVFTLLARKAESVEKHDNLAAWLFTTTRNLSLQGLRGKMRYTRKIEALGQELQSEIAPTSDALALLEEGIDSLREREREIVLARYFDGLSFRKIAENTGKSESACKMQLRRSLDKLGRWFGKRGVALSVGALGSVLSSAWVKAGSVGASAKVSMTAVSLAPSVKSGTLFLNTLLTMKASKSVALVAVALLLLCAVPLVVKARRIESLRAQLVPAPALDATSLKRSVRTSGLERNLPVARFAASTQLADDPREVANQILQALRGYGEIEMLRVELPLQERSVGEIRDLIERIAAADVPPASKDYVIPFLYVQLMKKGEDFQAVVTDVLESGHSFGSSLNQKIVAWVGAQPENRMKWFYEMVENRRFDQGRLDFRNQDSMARSLMLAVSESHPDEGMKLVGLMKESSQREICEGIFMGLGLKSENGRKEVVKMVEGKPLKRRIELLKNQKDLTEIPVDEIENFVTSLVLGEEGTELAYQKIREHWLKKDPSIAEQLGSRLSFIPYPESKVVR